MLRIFVLKFYTMATKKIYSTTDLMSAYMDFVLTHQKNPESVYVFTQSIKIKETEFYQHFASFEALENAIFKAFFENAITLLKQSDDFAQFDAKNQLLSFYFTFFEVLTQNRSYVLWALDVPKHKLQKLKKLVSLKQSFSLFVKDLDIKKPELFSDKLKSFQDKSLEELTWIQLLVILKFWMDDTSASFEKTDVFIEKCVTTSFDLMDTTPLNSLMDLGKFLFKEKTNFSF